VEREGTPQGTGQQERAAVVRGHNTILTLPHDAAAIRHFLSLALDRLDETAEPAIQALVLAADVEAVMAIGRVAAALERPPHATLLAIPSAQRGARALRAQVPAVIVATPEDLLELVRGSLAKLHAVRAVVFAWAEDLLAFDDAPLSTLVSELPKDAARILVAARLTSDVEAFAERYVRRIARATPAAAEISRVPLSYVIVSEPAKPSTLRRVLDTVDPESAVVYARTEEGARAARAELAGMGVAAAGVSLLTDVAAADGALLVLYELPAAADDLRTLSSGTSTRTVALVRARELPLLRGLTAAAPQPMALGGPADRARARETAMRDALRGVLADGVPPRDLLALEPLLEEYDGVEIAAAALRLLDRSRESQVFARAAAAAAPPAPPAPPVVPRGPVRLFINAGSRDNATARDFVGAIANVGGIPADRIGKVDVRESFTLVELQAADADSVVERLSGASIRGRRVSPRLDRDGGSPERGDHPSRERGDRPRERSDRPRERSDRPRERSDRPRERGERPRERSDRPRGGAAARDRGDRSGGRGAPARGSRPAPRGRRES
jgi:ATP-dependent RNA helicase DeaD